MSIRLVVIPNVLPEWEKAHKIRALEVDGRSPALAALKNLNISHHTDYLKLMATVRLVAENKWVRDESSVRKDKKGRGVYEMKGGKARLFFFYSQHDEVVVVTNDYWKTKSSRREQDIAFDRCCKLRDIYLRALSQEL